MSRPELVSYPLAFSDYVWFARGPEKPESSSKSIIGGVSERFMETVLKTVLVLMASVGSNPTPSANLNLNQT